MYAIYPSITFLNASTVHNPGDSRGILCCDVSPDGYTVVAGTELEGDDSLLLYWYIGSISFLFMLRFRQGHAKFFCSN